MKCRLRDGCIEAQIEPSTMAPSTSSSPGPKPLFSTEMATLSFEDTANCSSMVQYICREAPRTLTPLRTAPQSNAFIPTVSPYLITWPPGLPGWLGRRPRTGQMCSDIAYEPKPRYAG